jgi:hypothetical protein
MRMVQLLPFKHQCEGAFDGVPSRLGPYPNNLKIVDSGPMDLKLCPSPCTGSCGRLGTHQKNSTHSNTIVTVHIPISHRYEALSSLLFFQHVVIRSGEIPFTLILLGISRNIKNVDS